jgi:hypothetical protein
MEESWGTKLPIFFPCKTGPERNDFHYQILHLSYLNHGFIVPNSSQNQSLNEGISLPILDLPYLHSFMVPVPLYFSEDSCCKFPKWLADL